MRPDQHKRKKNENYKKNHGLGPKGSKQDESTQAKEAKGSHTIKSLGDESSKKKEIPTKFTENDKRNRGQEGGADYREEDEKLYQKEKLVSNWSRYEDLPSEDEDIPLQRGEDFNKLLAEAGGSASQFRFKDEEDWDGDTGASTVLDLEDIASAISCIPLHQRLGIATQLFDADQMKEMETVALEHKSHYEQGLKDKTKISETKTEAVIGKNVLNHNVKENKDIAKKVFDKTNNFTEKLTAKDTKSISSTTQKTTISTMNNSSKSNNDNLKQSTTAIKDTTCLSKEDKLPEKSREVMSLEDDLDMLLSLDNTGQSNTVEESISQKPLKVLSTKTVGSLPQKNKPVQGAKTEEDMTDWLDSMLDD